MEVDTYVPNLGKYGGVLTNCGKILLLTNCLNQILSNIEDNLSGSPLALTFMLEDQYGSSYVISVRCYLDEEDICLDWDSSKIEYIH